jgi:FkbM family methyltransferase
MTAPSLSQFSRALTDAVDLFRVLPADQALKWNLQVMAHLPEVVRTRAFYAPDEAMHGSVNFHYRGKQITYDLDEATPRTFSMLREFFVRDNYFGAFRKEELSLDRCFDFGCNEGRVAELMAILGDNKNQILAVDGNDLDEQPVRAGIARRHPNIRFVQAFILSAQQAARSDKDSIVAEMTADFGSEYRLNGQIVTPAQAVDLLGGDRIDFVKLDIEGAEFDIICDDRDWLQQVDNIAMEVHPRFGNPARVIEALRHSGFQVSWKANHVQRVPPEKADFVYGSRRGLLRNPS